MQSKFFRPKDRPLLNLALLVITFFTTFWAYLRGFAGSEPIAHAVRESLLFSISLILILGSHEMGHYVLARWHRVDTSLPYFIPLPYFGVGTLGAVIRIRGRIPSRNALVDIGAAGPLAGLLVAIPVLVVGIVRAKVVDEPSFNLFLGEGSLWNLAHHLWHYISGVARDSGELSAGNPSAFSFGDNLLTLLLQRLIWGPLPAGKTLLVGPMFLAGWFGLLVTMLNLIPIGQLDGGHLSYAVLGAAANRFGKVIALLMFGLCLFYSIGWLLWLVLAGKLIGFGHPPPLESDSPLSPGRRLAVVLSAGALILCVMPVPIAIISAP